MGRRGCIPYQSTDYISFLVSEAIPYTVLENKTNFIMGCSNSLNKQMVQRSIFPSSNNCKFNVENCCGGMEGATQYGMQYFLCRIELQYLVMASKQALSKVRKLTHRYLLWHSAGWKPAGRVIYDLPFFRTCDTILCQRGDEPGCNTPLGSLTNRIMVHMSSGAAPSQANTIRST